MAKHTKRRRVRKSRKTGRRMKSTRRGGFLGMGNSGLQKYVPTNTLQKWVFYRSPEEIDNFVQLDNTRRVKESYEVYKIKIEGSSITWLFNKSYFSTLARTVYETKILNAVIDAINYIYSNQPYEVVKPLIETVQTTLNANYPDKIVLNNKQIGILINGVPKLIDISKSIDDDAFKSAVITYYNEKVIPEFNSRSGLV